MSHRCALFLFACIVACTQPACTPQAPPPPYEVLRLHGTHYERGFQHGQALSSKIRSFYTTMLKTSLLPFFNREHGEIAKVLTAYLAPAYLDGQFSLMLLRESSEELKKSVPPDFLEEMRGVADGSGVPLADVLVLNTFVDTVLAARSVTYFLRQTGAPLLLYVDVAAAAVATDAVDNDGDGKTDEAGESEVEYAALTVATFVEVPLDAVVRLTLSDTEPGGVDPATVRVIVNGKAYAAGDLSLKIAPYPYKAGPSKTDVLVEWRSPQPLPAASVVTVGVQANDFSVVVKPMPVHARAMRTEQFTFTTKGYGKLHADVPNRGVNDGTSQPPSIAFAVRGAATRDGQPLLAHHFSLLDAGTSHKHTVLQIHEPKVGKPFAFVGWAGIIYGFAGVGANGVACSVNVSDSLNNPLADQVRRNILTLGKAKLMSKGLPVGFAVRQVLETATTAAQGAEMLQKPQHTFGWNFLVVDDKGGMQAVEAHANILEEDSAKPFAYGPETKDASGRLLASVGPDDLRITSHFLSRADDLTMSIGYDVRPQRFWSSYFFPSQRAFGDLGAAIASRLGQLDANAAIEVLRRPELVDRNDSMTAVVLLPKARALHVGLGTVPATDAQFDRYALPGGAP